MLGGLFCALRMGRSLALCTRSGKVAQRHEVVFGLAKSLAASMWEQQEGQKEEQSKEEEEGVRSWV